MGLGSELVITGSGVVSPIGVGKAAFWESLSAGRSGVRTLELLRDTPWPVRFGADVRDFEPKKHVKPRKSLKVMCREIQFGFAAATLALEDAALECEAVDCDRFGVMYASEMFYANPDDMIDAVRACTVDGVYHEELWGDHALSNLYPLWMLMHLPNMVACHLAIAHDARGPNNTIAVGDASSLLAVLEAADVIDRGQADVMIVGGTGSRISLAPMMYRGDANLSHRNDDPERASRPFELHRDGMVNGEGAAAVIIETRAHAEARGARPLARILSGGRSYESRLDGAPLSGDGLRRAVRQALADAGVSPQQLGHVNADGISCVEMDRVEAAALQSCLGEAPVTAPKSFFGNLGAGVGLVELAASLCALEHQQIPPTLNYESPDPQCPLQVVREPTLSDSPLALTVNQSSTGQCVALLLQRCD